MYIYTYTVYMTAYLHPGCRPANFSVPQHLEEEGVINLAAVMGHLRPSPTTDTAGANCGSDTYEGLIHRDPNHQD